MENFKNHRPSHNEKKTGDPSGRLFISILLNAVITLAEITGGILSNSLALISDAVHNLSDTLALVLAWTANRVGKRRPDERKTFGYKRFEILSAFINASVLTAVSLFLIYEAVIRFLQPEPVKTGLMFIIAVTGLAANAFSVLFLHRHAHGNLNVRAAYLHLIGDTLSSVAVVAGAVIIRYSGATWLDPALTLLISLVIMRQAWKILTESVNILMQGTPPGIDLKAIRKAIEENPLIRNIHHVHCWQLQDRNIHFEAHIETLSDMSLSESVALRHAVEDMLTSAYGITHSTLQIGYGCCDDNELIRQPH